MKHAGVVAVMRHTYLNPPPAVGARPECNPPSYTERHDRPRTLRIDSVQSEGDLKSSGPIISNHFEELPF